VTVPRSRARKEFGPPHLQTHALRTALEGVAGDDRPAIEMITEDVQMNARLKAVEERLAREFAGDGYANVSGCFERIAAELVAQARITDYLPVLVDRYTRACISAS
jgi:hypothetical protein